MHFDHHHGVAPAEPVPPQKDENHEAGGDVAFKGQVKANTTDCAGEAQRSQDLGYTDKTRATLAALLAIKGYSLHELADGTYLASKWNHTRPLRDLHAVQCFVRQVGAA